MRKKFTQTLLIVGVVLVSILLSGSLFASLPSHQLPKSIVWLKKEKSNVNDDRAARKTVKEGVQLVSILKDDFRYYFEPVDGGYRYVYAKHDPTVEMYDGFAYDDIVKVKVNGQLFSFTMYNGQPVFMSSIDVSSR